MSIAAFLFLAAACGGGGGDSGGAGGGSSQQTCSHQFGCINGNCSCSDGPKKGSSCCDPDDSTCTQNKCDSFCQHCS
jgi:hypothetical protein